MIPKITDKNMDEDYYKLLDVDKSASDAEIKKAFRAKAQKYHPDKPTGDEKKFKAINEAYSTLSDKQKRQQYDSFGKGGAQGGFGGGAGGFGGQGGGFDFSGFQQGAGGFEFDINDIFSQFGGGGGGGFGGGRRQSRGQDISVSITITFKESVFGVQKEFEIDKNSTCDECDGTGAEDKKTKTCTECKGAGSVARVQNTFMGQVQTQVTCPTCRGAGTIPEKNCHACGGDGVRRKKEKIKVRIPAGIEDGQQLRLSERGEAVAQGRAGDLYIQVRVTPQDGYIKVGSHLQTMMSISMTEAALGATKKIETLDGVVNIKIPAGSKHGSKLRVKGKGVVITENRRGDLYVELLIEVPKKLTKEQKQALESAQKLGL